MEGIKEAHRSPMSNTDARTAVVVCGILDHLWDAGWAGIGLYRCVYCGISNLEHREHVAKARAEGKLPPVETDEERDEREMNTKPDGTVPQEAQERHN